LGLRGLYKIGRLRFTFGAPSIFLRLRVVTLTAFRLLGVSRPLSFVAKPLLVRKQWVGEYVRH
jgi:hypothetical protein